MHTDFRIIENRRPAFAGCPFVLPGFQAILLIHQRCPGYTFLLIQPSSNPAYNSITS